MPASSLLLLCSFLHLKSIVVAEGDMQNNLLELSDPYHPRRSALLEGIASTEAECPTISIRQGTLRGKVMRSRSGRIFYSYKGIPYAKPPLGKLRFQAPEEPDPWPDTFQAAKEGNPCKQYNIPQGEMKGDEDCLYLNVYTPQVLQPFALKPVMVWIHGGAFLEGSSSQREYGPDYFVDNGVVLVTINYRLGVFGFLSTEDDVVPGNAGLKDQVAALRWVQHNIAGFGGDPGMVTIFGNSAGAASVQYHMLSPMSAGLFHGAIAQSGSVLNPWALEKYPRLHAFRLGRALSYNGDDNSSQELYQFLRTVHADRLVLASSQCLEDRNRELLLQLPFVPSIERADNDSESAFLVDNPSHILEQGNFQQVPFITGLTSGEGLLFLKVSGIMDNPDRIKEINYKFNNVFENALPRFKRKKNRRLMLRMIRRYYFGFEPLYAATLQNFATMCGDMFFLEGIIQGARKIAMRSAAPVFLYHFVYDGGLRTYKQAVYNAGSFEGVAHGDEVGYLFAVEGLGASLKPEDTDAIVRDHMVKLWTQFAFTGDPMPSEALDSPQWPPYRPDIDEYYLEIGSSLRCMYGLYQNRVEFWNFLYHGDWKIKLAKT